MDRELIIRLAQEAGLIATKRYGPIENYERFAALIEQHLTYDSIHSCHPNCDKPACVAMRAAVLAEREECAKVCDEVGGRDTDSHAWDAAAAIRSRT